MTRRRLVTIPGLLLAVFLVLVQLVVVAVAHDYGLATGRAEGERRGRLITETRLTNELAPWCSSEQQCRVELEYGLDHRWRVNVKGVR